MKKYIRYLDVDKQKTNSLEIDGKRAPAGVPFSMCNYASTYDEKIYPTLFVDEAFVQSEWDSQFYTGYPVTIAVDVLSAENGDYLSLPGENGVEVVGTATIDLPSLSAGHNTICDKVCPELLSDGGLPGCWRIQFRNINVWSISPDAKTYLYGDYGPSGKMRLSYSKNLGGDPIFYGTMEASMSDLFMHEASNSFSYCLSHFPSSFNFAVDLTLPKSMTSNLYYTYAEMFFGSRLSFKSPIAQHNKQTVVGGNLAYGQCMAMCTNSQLTDSAPLLPSISLNEHCYNSMFEAAQLTSFVLTADIQSLPAKYVPGGAYARMFSNASMMLNYYGWEVSIKAEYLETNACFEMLKNINYGMLQSTPVPLFPKLKSASSGFAYEMFGSNNLTSVYIVGNTLDDYVNSGMFSDMFLNAQWDPNYTYDCHWGSNLSAVIQQQEQYPSFGSSNSFNNKFDLK